MWSFLDMKRIYTKPRGRVPDYAAPVVVPASKATIEEFCARIHRSLLEQFKHALVWGASVKHGQTEQTH
jgi:ribosome-interacting GTPase 1